MRSEPIVLAAPRQQGKDGSAPPFATWKRSQESRKFGNCCGHSAPVNVAGPSRLRGQFGQSGTTLSTDGLVPSAAPPTQQRQAAGGQRQGARLGDGFDRDRLAQRAFVGDAENRQVERVRKSFSNPVRATLSILMFVSGS